MPKSDWVPVVTLDARAWAFGPRIKPIAAGRDEEFLS
jgi:hypothetical protein